MSVYSPEVEKDLDENYNTQKILEKSRKPWEGKRMTLNEYQEESAKTANFHGCMAHLDGYGIKTYVDSKLEAITYCSLGLTGEAGEVADNVKKLFRDDHAKLTPDRTDKLRAEIGDVLWYVANLSKALGFSLEEVATYNLLKLKNRYEK
mgnify:CR=1 FL=1